MTSDYVAAEPLELLSFFAVEPTPADPEAPWPYNDWVYETSVGDWAVSFAVAPAYRDVRLILKRREEIVYELNAVGISNLRYHSDKSGEWLEIILSERDTLHFRLRPNVSITHQVSGSSTEGN
jgi:hypothetical protein